MRVLDAFGHGSGHIFNLGHGITPDVPPEHVAVMVEAVHRLSPAFHGGGRMSQTERLDDWIEIHDLKVKTRIGVHAWEQQIDQTLSLDIRFPLTLGEATLTLSQTVDYDALCKAVITCVSTQAFELIETVHNKWPD